MNCFNFILTLHVFVSASSLRKDVCELTEADSRKITEIIRYEDSPLRIAAILGNRCNFTPNLLVSFREMMQLEDMIKYDRAESFKFLFPLIRFPANYWKEVFFAKLSRASVWIYAIS